MLAAGASLSVRKMVGLASTGLRSVMLAELMGLVAASERRCTGAPWPACSWEDGERGLVCDAELLAHAADGGG